MSRKIRLVSNIFLAIQMNEWTLSEPNELTTKRVQQSPFLSVELPPKQAHTMVADAMK